MLFEIVQSPACCSAAHDPEELRKCRNRNRVSKKLICYRAFHVEDCGEKDCKELLEQYPKVTRVYLKLDPTFQAVIKDICQRMGVGMAEFIEKEVLTVEDYDLYCHYVAGLTPAACASFPVMVG